MKLKTTFLFLMLIVLTNCNEQKAHSLADFEKLNGYWQITQATYPNGEKKEYRMPPAVDYIEIKGDSGFKKKMYPKLDGTYDTSNDALFFKLVTHAKKGYVIHYNDSSNSWQESLHFLGGDSFALKNETGFIYTYKRYQPIELELK